MSDTVIKILKDGPLLVSGGARLENASGEEVDGGDRDSYALCRCGASKNKPFCDGSHRAEGFCDG